MQVQGGNARWTSFFIVRKSMASACTCLRSSCRSWLCKRTAVDPWLWGGAVDPWLWGGVEWGGLGWEELEWGR